MRLSAAPFIYGSQALSGDQTDVSPPAQKRHLVVKGAPRWEASMGGPTDIEAQFVTGVDARIVEGFMENRLQHGADAYGAILTSGVADDANDAGHAWPSVLVLEHYADKIATDTKVAAEKRTDPRAERSESESSQN
jgi:hypothetical protein